MPESTSLVVYWLMVFVASCPCLFFLSTLTRISVSGTCFTCAIKWQCPSCSLSTFKTWLWLCVPLLSSCSTGNSSPGSFPHISLLAVLCGTCALQSRKGHYTEDIHSSCCAGWEKHLFSLMIISSKYLEGFFFCHRFLWLLCQAMLPFLPWWNFIAQPQVCSQTQRTHWHLGYHQILAEDPQYHLKDIDQDAVLALPSVKSSALSVILKLRYWKTEILRTVWVI